MNKYFSPAIQIEKVETADIILASQNVNETVTGYTIKPLEDIDTGNDKSAVFDVSRWL